MSIGLLYIFTTYAVDVAFGPDKFAGFGTSGTDSWEGLARGLYGAFWVLVFLAIWLFVFRLLRRIDGAYARDPRELTAVG